MMNRPTWWKMFASQREAVESIPDEAAGAGLKAAFRYFDGEEVTVETLPPLAYTAFCLIKPFIDKSIADYKKKSEAGKAGMAVRWQTGQNVITPYNTPTTPIASYTEERREKKEEREKKKEGIEADKPPTLTPKRRFVPPTLEEVTSYVKERGSKIDPQGFIDFYAAKGWMVGKSPMKDWKAACRNAENWERWERRSSKAPRSAKDYDEGGPDFLGR